MTRPFRFGHTLFSADVDRAIWLDRVRLAEQSGFGVLTVSDHFRTTGGIFAALQAAYEAAPTLRIGTLVLNNDFWHPSLLAREVITADILSQGGFELGIGAGWDEPDYLAMGVPRRKPSERIDRLREAVRVLRQAFDTGSVSFHGEHYDVEAPSAWPRPVQQRLPILVGGGSPRILRLAAQVADVVSIHRNLERGVAGSWEREKEGNSEFADIVSERIEWVREAAGDRFRELELHALVLRAVFTRDRHTAAADLGRAGGLAPEQVLASPHYLIGDAEQIADELLRRRERWGISYWTLVDGGQVASFGKVVARLAGS